MSIYWTTKDGRKIEIAWMSSAHIVNTWRLFRYQTISNEQHKALLAMTKELEKRGYNVEAPRITPPRETPEQLAQINALLKSGYPTPTVAIIYKEASRVESLWNSIKNAACLGDKKAQKAIALAATYRLKGMA